jgi:parallel beta-helix repeat protein
MQRLLKSIVLALAALGAVAHADEGRIAVTGTMTITAPGSYILVNNITSTSGFYIQSSNVKLDLNGFTISSAGGFSTDGITIGKVRNIEITNGTITGFPRHGIFAPGGSLTSPSNIKLRNLSISDHRVTGISLENHAGFLIDNCTISNNTGVGVYANGAGLMLNNVIGANTTGLASFSAGKMGYRLNVFHNNSQSVSGSAMNLGSNICDGVACP